jgi:hypothetical protein
MSKRLKSKVTLKRNLKKTLRNMSFRWLNMKTLWKKGDKTRWKISKENMKDY